MESPPALERSSFLIVNPCLSFRNKTIPQPSFPSSVSPSPAVLLDPTCTSCRQWHGFLAPHELPTELVSLVLMVTISMSDFLPHNTNGSHPGLVRIKSPIVGDACLPSEPELPSTTSSYSGVASQTAGIAVGAGASVNLGRDSEPPRVVVERSENHGVNTEEQHSRDAVESPPPLLLPPHEGPALPAWELSLFDNRLACPKALGSAVEVLLSEQQRGQLSTLVQRSAFVLPGREGMVLSAFKALAEGRQVFFLVAILPVLEHGLRCLFACANDSPAHLFAQLRQYYSTLDGVRSVFSFFCVHGKGN